MASQKEPLEPRRSLLFSEINWIFDVHNGSSSWKTEKNAKFQYQKWSPRGRGALDPRRGRFRKKLDILFPYRVLFIRNTKWDYISTIEETTHKEGPSWSPKCYHLNERVSSWPMDEESLLKSNCNFRKVSILSVPLWFFGVGFLPPKKLLLGSKPRLIFCAIPWVTRSGPAQYQLKQYYKIITFGL